MGGRGLKDGFIGNGYDMATDDGQICVRDRGKGPQLTQVTPNQFVRPGIGSLNWLPILDSHASNVTPVCGPLPVSSEFRFGEPDSSEDP